MALQILPIELHQHIAVYIESDKDLCAFTLACRQTHAAVFTPGVWRKRFAQRYDPSSGKSSQEVKQLYQSRASILAQGTIFRDGQEQKELRCLELMRDLMIESFGRESASFEGRQSHNIEQLHQIVLRTNLLHNVFRNGFHKSLTSELLLTLQLVLTHWSLDIRLQVPTFGGEISQQAAYQPTDTAPIFSGPCYLSVDVEWLLHIANFFKYHLTRQREYTLYETYLDLEHYEKPRAWRSKVQGGVKKLEKYWKGIYSYLSDKDLTWVREMEPGIKPIMDEIEQSGIHDVEFDFGDHVNAIPWPDAFEVHLDSKDRQIFLDSHQSPTPAKTLRFEASGLGSVEFDSYGSGFVQELPPQQGIPGWQRFTMMKYAFDEDGFYKENSLWAYEGCVLPGGQVILGRWWAPSDDPANDGSAYSGPFIFWCIGDDGEMDHDSDSGYGSGCSPP